MSKTIGAQKRWAKKLGLTYEEYLSKIESGLKRCTKCHQWKQHEDYPKDSSRYDGLNTKCHKCIRLENPRKPTIPEWAKDALRERNKKFKWRKGIPLSKEHREHLREVAYEQKRFHGENSPQWKGGITPINRLLRGCSAYRQWRDAVFKRDEYTCQVCGDNRGGNLNAHHKKPWAEHKDLRYNVDNGITVCKSCHEKIHSKPIGRRKPRKRKSKQ